jgi:hypothetical protein
MGAIQALRQVNSNRLTLKAFAVVAIQLQPFDLEKGISLYLVPNRNSMQKPIGG